MSRQHDSTTIQTKEGPRTHKFYAEATAISGKLHLPLPEKIEPQANAHLYHMGGYLSQHSGAFRVEGAISFDKAYTQVAGNIGSLPHLPDLGKDGHGWLTLSTVVVEGLNVMEVLTADRVVAQVITDHPPEGYVPHISFLGTRFENLKIAGHKIDVTVNPYILGGKSLDGTSLYSDQDPVKELAKAQFKQYQSLLKQDRLRRDLKAKYESFTDVEEYQKSLQGDGSQGAVEFSLATMGKVPSALEPYVWSSGNLLKIWDFGVVELAKVKIEHRISKLEGVLETEVSLTMIDLHLGCAIAGDTTVARGTNSGTSHP